jgi:DNA invertase Pin-like site-specific DNA recombinase
MSRKRTKRDTKARPLWSVSQNAVPKRSIGYVRVSKTSQTVQQQTDALKKAGVVAIFGDEGISGSRRDRPGLDAALADLRAGDVLRVVALDRLGRSLADLVAIMQTLHDRGAHLRSLREAIDTTTAAGRMLFGIFGALAEYERAMTIERTAERLSAMKRRGLPIGRKPALTGAQIDMARNELARGTSAVVVARNLGCGRSTLYRHLASQP